MDLGLAGRRALVLASSSGFGKAIATVLVREGAVVSVNGRDPERLALAVADTGASAAVAGDLNQPDEATRIVDEAAAKLGGLDIIVINTGGGGPGALSESTRDSRDRAYRSMLRPALDAAAAALPLLRQSGAGRMIFITARSVLEASTDLALSSVFRSGVAACARSLAVELAPEVLVNVIVPGQFDTPAYHRFRSWLARRDGVADEEITRRHVAEIPVGRLGKAVELADVVAFLCSARASFVTGTVIRVDGGAVRGFH